VRKLPSFAHDPQQSFRAWLRTVLRNRCVTLLRTPSVVLPAAGSAQVPEPVVADGLAKWEDEEYRRQLMSRTLRLLQRDFQPVTWQAFWDFVVCQRLAAEVGAAHGISVDSVYSAKSRVLRRLREELKGLLD